MKRREIGTRRLSFVVTPRSRSHKSNGRTSMTRPADQEEQVRASLNTMDSSTALPPPPRRTHTISSTSSPPRKPIRQNCTLKSTFIESSSENETSDDENLHKTAHKTPSFHSVSSTDSGIDLDEKNKNLHNKSINAARRMRSRRNLSDENSIEHAASRSLSRQSSRSVASASSSHSAKESNLDQAGIPPVAPVAALPPPGAAGKGTTSSRPSDEKRNCRISMASSNPTRRPSSPLSGLEQLCSRR